MDKNQCIFVLLAAIFAVQLVNAASIFEKDDIQRQIIGFGTSFERFPWVVEISEGNSCYGSIINKKWVLTAASCVYRNNLKTITVGEYRETVDVSKVIIYHAFDPEKLYNNIALIKIEGEFTFNATINEIRLATYADRYDSMEEIDVQTQETRPFNLTYSKMNYVDMKTISNSDCADTFTDTYVKSFTICANAQKDNGTCGSRGSPLTYREEDIKHTLIGVLTGSHPGCQNEYPALFTRVAFYLDWINEKTDIDIRDSSVSIQAMSLLVLFCVVLQKIIY